MLIFAELAAAPEVTCCAPAPSVEGQAELGQSQAAQPACPYCCAHQGEFVLGQHNEESRAEVTKSLKSSLALWGAEQSLALFCTKY